MKKTYFLLFVLFVTGNLQAQVFWLNDLESAKSVAKESNKLIVMDFWATWCVPCKVMDEKLWQSSEMVPYSKNFVGVKIDFDNNHTLAIAYNTQAIPKVVLATASGDVIWEEVGFQSADSYIKILKAVPVNVGVLNKYAVACESSKKDPRANYDYGLAFQSVGKDVTNDNLKRSFLKCCEDYLSKAQKLSKDENFNAEIELYTILNDVYNGKPEKAMKKLDKQKARPGNNHYEDIRHFVWAKCYQGTKDQENFAKEKQLISNQDLIAQLE
jgi:thiol-disulfide isomerase/thioredoxin